MKEYTITYTAEVTEIIKGELSPNNDPETIAKWVKRELNADDVKVKNVKVFERDA